MGLILRKDRKRNREFNWEDLCFLMEASAAALVDLGRVNDFFEHGEKLDPAYLKETHDDLDRALEMFRGRSMPEDDFVDGIPFPLR